MDVVRGPVHRFQSSSINVVLTSSMISRVSILLGMATGPLPIIGTGSERPPTP